MRRVAPHSTADPRAAVVDGLVTSMRQIERAVRLLHGKRIRLFIQAVRGDRGRGCPPFRVHAFQYKPVVVQFRQDRVTTARNAAERSAFDNLRHMHGKPDRKPENHRQGREYCRVAGTSRHDYVDVGFERLPERPHAHLSDDMDGFNDIFLGQCRHAIEA